MSATPASDLSLGTVVGGTYEVTGLLGRGGMGAVFLASHTRLPGKRVAIKVLLGSPSTEVLARFRREAEIASRIGHPNIVEVLDWNTLPDGSPYIVLEFLQGESLEGRLKRVGSIPYAQTVEIVRQIGSALAAAHRADVVHRDLKPANIFLCPSDSGGVFTDRVKVLDFGISKIKDSTTVQTQEAQLLGTPQYMSPEQAAGKNKLIDQRTDVFALGAIIAEMLTGESPFAGDNVAQIVYKVVFDPHEAYAGRLPGVPEKAGAAIDRALAKKPEDRWPDVKTFVEAFTGSPLLTLATSAQPPPPGMSGATTGQDDAFGSTMAGPSAEPARFPAGTGARPADAFGATMAPAAAVLAVGSGAPVAAAPPVAAKPEAPLTERVAKPDVAAAAAPPARRGVGLTVAVAAAALLAGVAVTAAVVRRGRRLRPAVAHERRAPEPPPLPPRPPEPPPPPMNPPPEAKPGETKPGETKPGETKAGETKPGETKPGETKPGETKPGETKPGETKPGETPLDGRKRLAHLSAEARERLAAAEAALDKDPSGAWTKALQSLPMLNGDEVGISFAYAVAARAACRQHDLGKANGVFPRVRPVERRLVLRECRKLGLELQE